MAKSKLGMSDSEDSQASDSEADQSCTNPATTCQVKPSIHISILIESLVKNLCHLYEPNPEHATRTYGLICEKLFTMRLIDESFAMAEFEGMRNQYQRALHHLLTTASGSDHQEAVPIRPLWPDVDITNEWSHYYQEFDEIEYIAGGGFGKVYKVKHKLDGTEYAVKKIYIRSEGIKSVRNYLKEVKTFASLNHSNIVQYKAAWLEMGADTGRGYVAESMSDSELSFSSNENLIEKVDTPVDTYIYPNMISEVENSFNEVKHDSSDFEVSFKNSIQLDSRSPNVRKLRQSREKRSSISEGGNAICTIKEIREIQMQSRPHPKWATLYIQMTLCQMTLKQWLENRNANEVCSECDAAIVPISGDIRVKTIMEIINQLLQGLEYIHSKSIVHHDIKPSNIFLQIDNGLLLVQLGDFGLACPLQSARHTLALGTKLYAAPEQLNGYCHRKSDMYSLGIVMLELAECFQTDMERVESINELRKGNLPPSLESQYPQLAGIIRQLVVNNLNDRPDATSLLKRLQVEVVESEVVRQLRSQIVEKDQEILRLKALLEKSGMES